MKIKAIDLTQPMGIMTPPFPGGQPMRIRYTNRISGDGYGQQEYTFTTHTGTHLDGPLHFDAKGEDLASLTMDKLFGEGAIVDVSEVGEYGIYGPKNVTNKVEVKPGDILIIHTGFHKYYIGDRDPDEIAYFYKHPGPHREFRDWCAEMKFKWLGIDAASQDHPMNISDLRNNVTKNSVLAARAPGLVREFEKKHGKKREEIFPDEMEHLMHWSLFPKPHQIIHVENVGGDIDKVLNRRAMIGCFPLRIVDGESSPCRLVAFIEE
jgi:arylformamidase